MVCSSYTLTGSNIEIRVAEFVRNFFKSAYESKYEGGFLRVFEDYGFWKKHNYMVCIRVDTSDVRNGKMKIEVIAGGNADNIISGSVFGGENRKIDEFAKELQKFCVEQVIEYTAN